MVCTKLLSRGWEVCFPARGLSPPYDMLVVKGGSTRKVQVKRAYVRQRGKQEQLRVNITNSNGSVYGLCDVDFLCIADVINSQVWMIPLKEVLDQKTLSLSGGKYDFYLI